MEQHEQDGDNFGQKHLPASQPDKVQDVAQPNARGNRRCRMEYGGGDEKHEMVLDEPDTAKSPETVLEAKKGDPVRKCEEFPV